MKNNKLKKYREKRKFKNTPEPMGKIGVKDNRKFVVQKHAASHHHYDFRLELNGVLISWAIPKGPSSDPSIKRLAVHVEDHPLSYANFEGIIPKGHYGAGRVRIWDKGRWIAEDKNPDAAYRKGHLTFLLNGKKLKGKWSLIRINKNDKTWLLIKSNDKYAKSDIRDKSTGKKSKKLSRDMANISILFNNSKSSLKSSKFPTHISPQLATLVEFPPSGKNWLHEIKLDGYRILAFRKNMKASLYTRNGINWTSKFTPVADAISKLPFTNLIFDGEIVCLDKKNHSNFQLLQNAINKGNGNKLIYYIFDLLYYDKFNLMELPLDKRKSILKRISKYFNENILRYNDHISGLGKKVFKKTCELSLEGIVSKNADSAYVQKRSRNWLKCKCRKRQEFVIGGFTKPKGSRQRLGSLLIGTFNKRKQLVYHGRVGTGFTFPTLNDIYKKLIKLSSDKSPFFDLSRGIKNVSWIKPKLVAEIEFSEWTKDNILRHPVFKGLRKDKSAGKIHQEKVIKETRRGKK